MQVNGRRLRRALLRGRRADFWYSANHQLILRHPNGRDEFTISIDDLPHSDRMARHYDILDALDWVSDAAIDELEAIAAGARV